MSDLIRQIFRDMEVNFGDDGAGSYPSLFATHLPFQIDASLGFVVALPVAARDLAVWDVTRDRFVNEPGCYRLLAGRSSRDVPLSADVDVHGEPVPPRTALGDGVRAVDFDDADGIQIPERTREKGAAVQVPPRAAAGWVVLRSVDAPASGGRHSWSEVSVEPGPAWDRLTAGIVDVRLLLNGAVRVGELLLT